MAKFLQVLAAITLIFLAIFGCHAESNDSRKVYLVYLDPSLGHTREAYLQILAKVLEGFTPAESLVYSYQSGGFSARLTVNEAENLKRFEGVWDVQPDKIIHIDDPVD